MNISITDVNFEELKELIALIRGSEQKAPIVVPQDIVIEDKKIDDPKPVVEMTSIPEGYMTLKEASKILGKAPNTLSFHASHNGMDCIRVGRRVYLNPDKCKDFVTAHDIHATKSTKKTKKKESTKKTKEPSHYSKWVNNIKSEIREQKRDEGKTLSDAYKYMTKNYGIVWDQVKKDARANGDHDYMYSTLRLAYWLECLSPEKDKYANLLEASVHTVLHH